MLVFVDISRIEKGENRGEEREDSEEGFTEDEEENIVFIIKR